MVRTCKGGIINIYVCKFFKSDFSTVIYLFVIKLTV